MVHLLTLTAAIFARREPASRRALGMERLHCHFEAMYEAQRKVMRRRPSKPAVSVGLTPMGDGERIKLTIAPLVERPSSAEDSSANIRASLQSAAATPERPFRLALDVDSTPIPSVAASPSATFRVGHCLATPCPCSMTCSLLMPSYLRLHAPVH